MTATPSQVSPGDFVVYTYYLSNTGGQTVSNAVLTDTIPNNISLSTADAIGGQPTSSSGGSGASAGQTLTWSALSLAPGQTKTLTISAVVSGGTATGTSITNSAMLTYPSRLLKKSAFWIDIEVEI